MLQHYILLLAMSPQAIAWFKIHNFQLASEAPWTPPEETSRSENGLYLQRKQLAQGWTPRPTEAPKALFGRMKLLPRQENSFIGGSTCGFLYLTDNPFMCNNSSMTCTYSEDFFGCCGGDSCTLRTSCINWLDWDGSDVSESDLHTTFCTNSSHGECFTWELTTTDIDEELWSYSYLECNSQEGTGYLVDYNPSLVDPSSTTETTTASSNSTSHAETTTSSGGGNDDEDDGDKDDDGVDGGAGNNDNNDDSNDNNNDYGGDDGGGSNNIGAIAGGTVGGVIALALIGAAAFLFLRRRKDSKNMASPSSPAIAEQPYSHESSSGAYTSGVPANFQGYPMQGSPQNFDQRSSGYGNSSPEVSYYAVPQSQQQQMYDPRNNRYPK